ncbi:RNase adapter RapZ [Endothiovibrio diazotrophicus]
MKLVIVSGFSGAGKHIAMHTLEDLGYHCVDNLPVALLEAFAGRMAAGEGALELSAVGIDARNRAEELARFPETVERLKGMGLELRLLFLQSDPKTLIRRFSETRRRHPLTRGAELPLAEALEREQRLLAPIACAADHCIDTSHTTLHELRELVSRWAEGTVRAGPTLQFQSFGYKRGIPSDADFVFDARCLPNPYWQPELRGQTGRDEPVRRFLDGEPEVDGLFTDLVGFLESMLPRFARENRSYITIAVGCTGGQHRSVYLVERLAAHFRCDRGQVLARHRELS